MKTFFLITVLALASFCCSSPGREKTSPDDSLQYYPPTPAALGKTEFRQYYRELTAFFDSTLFRFHHFNGQVLVAKNGTILYEKYSGKADLRKKDTMSAGTPLHIASTSKTFTAVTVLRLVQEGRLSLDDSLSKFFPSLPYPGITVKMLLNHRSGLPNYVHFMDKTSWDKKRYCSNEDVLGILVKEHPDREASPGRKFSYCNTNYLLLALIIEQLTGKSYPEYMREKIFTPLQMKDTYVFTLKDTLSATPSFTASGTYWDYDFLDGTYGDKNIYTTARDLLKWDQALYTGQVIHKALLDSAFAPYSFERPSVHNYGLGWRMMLLPGGKKIVYHFGKWHGSNAAFARLMDEKVTIIILGNRFTRGIYNTAHQCYDLFGDYFQRGGNEEDEPDTLPGKKTATGRNSKTVTPAQETKTRR
ncbi:MAG: beta-lactamase family protein [Sphingobacteriales bacterium]|nr:beta-lactamase family protein [Sphingobacteriales bacterium]